MSTKRCIILGCKKEPVVHVHRAWNHRIGQETHVCADHIEGFLNSYYEMHIVGDGESRSCGEGVVFDIEMVLYDERPDKPCQFSLREVGGSRRLDCGIGIFEATSLQRELERFVTPRPLTHRAMASVITSLGGRLDCVVIDKFVSGKEAAYFEAKLHIQQKDAVQIVDVRPSDAVVLAVICDVPIVVSNDVLAGLTDSPK
jgi:uncharacterized protein